MNSKGISRTFNRLHDGCWLHIMKSDEIIDITREGAFDPNLNDCNEAPNGRRTPEDDIVRQLSRLNRENVKKRIDEGDLHKDRLFKILSDWSTSYDQSSNPKFTFLGIRTTTDCNLAKRCIYCDQKQVNNRVRYDNWKQMVDVVTEDGTRKGVYIGISGGEPLTDGELLYGNRGLIRYAADRGGVVNLNSNAHLINPPVAMSLIGSGLAKIHISLDASDEKVHDKLELSGSFKRVLESIYTIQMAKAIVGVKYPVMHINTVATRQNLLIFDDLLEFLLNRRRLADDYSRGNTHTNPDLRDLAPHLIPLGGERNYKLRPTEQEWKMFIEEVWPRASKIWEEFQERYDVPTNKRSTLQEICFFSNPFTRVDYNADLKEVIRNFSEGEYSRLALTEQCYSMPTQAYIWPNGNVYPCGSYSDVNPSAPIGNILHEPLVEIIKKNVCNMQPGFDKDMCGRCYGSTLAINQKVESNLMGIISCMIDERQPQPRTSL